MSSNPVITFIGATGGCTFASLVLALKNGYICYARDFWMTLYP